MSKKKTYQAFATSKRNRLYSYFPDLPDKRDYYYTPSLITLAMLPPGIDLSHGMTKVEDQGQLGSCVAHGVTALIEHIDFLKDRRYLNRSRLFLYYEGRVLEGTVKEDSGLYIRDGVKVVAKQGVPRETLWPYDISKFKLKPSLNAYEDGSKHQAIDYQRVDQTRLDFLSALAEGYPIVFGFSVYQSFETNEVAKTGIVPIPSMNEYMLGGHCVVACGYDLKHSAGEMVLCKNSWGTRWGTTPPSKKSRGYFWIPLAYLLDGDLAEDFWIINIVEGIK